MVVFGRTPVISALSAADKVFFCLPLNWSLKPGRISNEQ